MSDQSSRQPGQICTWTGEAWKPLTGPGAEESISEAFGALDTLLTTLETLRGMDKNDLAQPGSAQQWEEHLLATDAADATLALVLEELEAELEGQHRRDTGAAAYRDPPPWMRRGQKHQRTSTSSDEDKAQAACDAATTAGGLDG